MPDRNSVRSIAGGIAEISLAINEIFVSIQGESTWAGYPMVFVRTTGCPLRCRWCDTEYAFYEGRRWRLPDLVEETCRPGLQLIEITGGEPLAQPGVPPFAAALLERGKIVLIETSGAYDISVLPEGTIRIMDLKCPSSQECERNDFANLDHLEDGDEIKFVIATREDYDWAVAQIRGKRLAERWPVLLSPVWGELAPHLLADWVLADGLPVRLQLQLHKIIWPGVERGI
ncbi:MAG: radical SAM protein [Acidobacteriota bacterium]